MLHSPTKAQEVEKADRAYQVWCALKKAALADPQLAQNSYFAAICEEVYSDFCAAFERA